MSKQRWVFLLLLFSITVLLASSVQAMSSPVYRLDWLVPLSGGGGTASSAAYHVQFTVGQTVTGRSAGEDFAGRLGYWYGVYPYWLAYMPVIAK